MPKYTIQASYVGEGLKRLLKEGGTKRRDTPMSLAETNGHTEIVQILKDAGAKK
jgi:hypothetical protein